MNILITGATGFIGSHIAEKSINNGHKVIALKQPLSSIDRCKDFSDRIIWIDFIDNIEFMVQILSEFNPKIFIHCAWKGVNAEERNSVLVQTENILFFAKLLLISQRIGIKKIIVLGSQAEYGYFTGRINESVICNPITPYGIIKYSSSLLLKQFAEQNNLEWYWLRLFSVYGPKEGPNWLIPSVISHIIFKKTIDLTPCEQMYDYIYVEDLANAIVSICNCDANHSGVYNLSSNQSYKLIDVLNFIENYIGTEGSYLRFGAIPYREKQIMHYEGDSTKFYQTFRFNAEHNLKNGLIKTIEYFKDYIPQ